MNLLTSCYVQTICDVLEQLVESLLVSSTLLEDDNNLIQTSCVNICEQAVRTHPVDKLWEFLSGSSTIWVEIFHGRKTA
jgi:hypothetical protein